MIRTEAALLFATLVAGAHAVALGHAGWPTATTMDLSRPFCIGVAGGTASGKTTVVQKIVELLQLERQSLVDSTSFCWSGHAVASVTQDCFYRSLTPSELELANSGDYNFDHPNAFDWEQTLDVIRALRSGARSVAVPTYDFCTHKRLAPEHDTHVAAPQIVIFEGILALHDERVRDLLDMKIFVDTDADVRLSRRIRRDMESRGRDLSGILQQYERFVKPAHDTFVSPTKATADIVVPRGAENVVAIELIAQHISGLLIQRSAIELVE